MVGDAYAQLRNGADDGAYLEIEGRTLGQQILVVVHLPEVLLCRARVVASVVFGVVERQPLVDVPKAEIESEIEDVVDVEAAGYVVLAHRTPAVIAQRGSDVAVFGQAVQTVHVVAAQTGE